MQFHLQEKSIPRQILMAAAAIVVIVPGAPLLAILVLTQVLNAVLLVPLLVLMLVLARDRSVLGDDASRGAWWALELVGAAIVVTAVAALGVVTFTSLV